MGDALDTIESASVDGREVTELTSLDARIAAGDRQAEQQLLARLFPAVGVICRRHFGKTADADDALQQALEIVLGKLRAGGVSNLEAIMSYISTTVQHIKCNALRVERNHPSESLPDGDQLDRIATSDDESAEREAERAEVRNAIHDVMRHIKTPRDLGVLHRRYILEQEKAEICGALHIDDRHFDRVIHRAKHRLRAALQPFWTSRRP